MTCMLPVSGCSIDWHVGVRYVHVQHCMTLHSSAAGLKQLKSSLRLLKPQMILSALCMYLYQAYSLFACVYADQPYMA